MAYGGERFRAEQIIEIGCPKCGAVPGRFCDRRGDKLSRQGRVLAASGTPPSHTERMWLRQGHTEDEFPALRSGLRPGEYKARGGGGERPLVLDFPYEDPAKPGTARASGYGI